MYVYPYTGRCVDACVARFGKLCACGTRAHGLLQYADANAIHELSGPRAQVQALATPPTPCGGCA
eukprot:6185275-Alexandrium_andersonii.AAC.1